MPNLICGKSAVGGNYNSTRDNENGNVTSSSQYRHEYDAEGNRTKYIEYTSYGNIKLQEEWKYDANGNVIEYTKYDGDDIDDICEKIQYIIMELEIKSEPVDCIDLFIEP